MHATRPSAEILHDRARKTAHHHRKSDNQIHIKLISQTTSHMKLRQIQQTHTAHERDSQSRTSPRRATVDRRVRCEWGPRRTPHGPTCEARPPQPGGRETSPTPLARASAFGVPPRARHSSPSGTPASVRGRALLRRASAQANPPPHTPTRPPIGDEWRWWMIRMHTVLHHIRRTLPTTPQARGRHTTVAHRTPA
jgi:hypothetical protein